MNRIAALFLPGLVACGFQVASQRAPDGEPASLPQDEDEGFTQAELEELTEQIKGEVEDLRGLQFERPVRVAVTDRDGFLAYAKKRIEKTTSTEEIAAQELVAKLTGMLPPDYDLLGETLKVLEEQVGGFYDPSENAFFLMDSFGGDLARVILAHELTHALDDQHYDIDGTLEKRKGDSDGQFAFSAVVEGSGTAVMNAWVMERIAELDPKALTEASGMSMDEIAKAPPFVWRPLLASYLCGAAFLHRTDSVMKGQMGQPDADDFDRAFEEPPLSSEQILHPAKYWEAGERDAPVSVRIVAQALPAGWSSVHEDTLGELGLALVTQPLDERSGMDQAAMLGGYTSDAAEGWGGDRCVLLARGEARVLVALSVWDTEEDAAEFREVLGGFSEHLASGASALAKLRGVEGSACLLRAGKPARSTLLAVAAGADEKTLGELLAALAFEVGK